MNWKWKFPSDIAWNWVWVELNGLPLGNRPIPRQKRCVNPAGQSGNKMSESIELIRWQRRWKLYNRTLGARFTQAGRLFAVWKIRLRQSNGRIDSGIMPRGCSLWPAGPAIEPGPAPKEAQAAPLGDEIASRLADRERFGRPRLVHLITVARFARISRSAPGKNAVNQRHLWAAIRTKRKNWSFASLCHIGTLKSAGIEMVRKWTMGVAGWCHRGSTWRMILGRVK